MPLRFNLPLPGPFSYSASAPSVTRAVKKTARALAQDARQAERRRSAPESRPAAAAPTHATRPASGDDRAKQVATYTVDWYLLAYDMVSRVDLTAAEEKEMLARLRWLRNAINLLEVMQPPLPPSNLPVAADAIQAFVAMGPKHGLQVAVDHQGAQLAQLAEVERALDAG